MARKPLNQAAKAFLSGEESQTNTTAQAQPNARDQIVQTIDNSRNPLLDALSLTPQEKPTPMTITILPSRKNKLQQLSQSTGRNMSELIGIALDRMFNEANM